MGIALQLLNPPPGSTVYRALNLWTGSNIYFGKDYELSYGVLLNIKTNTDSGAAHTAPFVLRA